MKKNKYIIFSLIGILLLMIVGFASFSQRLEIGDSSEITTNWNILITDIKTVGGTGTNNTEPSYERLTANFDVIFENISDYIEYEITVSNLGDVVANLNDIEITNGNSDMVSMTYSGINVGDTLGIDESKTFNVKLLYKGGSGEGTSEITINYAQNANPEEIIIPKENVKVVYDYETNGGIVGEITEKYFDEGESVDLNINAKKEGYTFIGWNTDKDANTPLSSLIMPGENVILYAIYGKEIKVTYKLSEGIYKIGKESETCLIYNNEKSCTITLPNIEVNPGYILDGWHDLENRYEVGSEIVLTEDKTLEARTYDNTPAELTVSTSKTTKSITVIANTISDAPIDAYEYSIDGGATYTETSENTYTFDNLKHDTPYNIRVKVTTKALKTTESEIIEVSTNLIETPTFKEEVIGTVEITYPEGCASTYTCSYIKDEGEEVIVTETNFEVIFDADGTLIAKVTDGKNYITSGAYTVVVNRIFTFDYTGNYEEFVVPYSGIYKVELWGSGGEVYELVHSETVGKGAYVSGEILFEKNLELFIYVGNVEDFNGGGIGEAGGGGSTDIRLIAGEWNNFDSLKSRIIVAAGGGGGIIKEWNGYQYTYEGDSPGHGGGLNGYDANYNITNASVTGYGYSGHGATQIDGGLPGKSSGYYELNPETKGGFGYGGYSNAYIEGLDIYNHSSGGGSGYYGGGHGVHTNNAWTGGGGGSSFISGHNGCDAILDSSTEDNVVHSGQSIHYSNYQFTNTIMIDGKGYNWTTERGSYVGMPTHDGTSTMEGNTGNGYAKITLLEVTQ